MPHGKLILPDRNLVSETVLVDPQDYALSPLQENTYRFQGNTPSWALKMIAGAAWHCISRQELC